MEKIKIKASKREIFFNAFNAAISGLSSDISLSNDNIIAEASKIAVLACEQINNVEFLNDPDAI